MDLSKTEKEILRLYTEEYLTTRQIAIRRGKTFSAVNKIKRSLQKKGYLKLGLMRGKNLNVPPNAPPSKLEKIRLHGQEFNIKIIYRGDRYKRLLESTNIKYVDGNTIRLYERSIEVYGNRDFYGKDAQEATATSMRYWKSFFIRLENELQILIIKPGKANIRMVKNHYAEIDNELSQDAREKQYKVHIYATEDNKLWFSIDNSFNLDEAETQHGKTAKADMEAIVQPFFNDLRDNEAVTISQIKAIIKAQADVNKETAEGLASVVLLMKQQSPKPQKENPMEKPDYFG